MRRIGLRKLVASFLLGTSMVAIGAVSPIVAQPPQEPVTTPVVTDDTDDGFDWGWIGLLGLAGLLGLKRRDTDRIDTTRTRL